MTSLVSYLRALGDNWYVVFVYRHQPPFPRPTREDAELCLRIRQDPALSVVRHHEVCYIDASGTSSGWHEGWRHVGDDTLVVNFRYNGLHGYDHWFHLSDGYVETRCGVRQRIRFWYGTKFEGPNRGPQHVHQIWLLEPPVFRNSESADPRQSWRDPLHCHVPIALENDHPVSLEDDHMDL